MPIILSTFPLLNQFPFVDLKMIFGHRICFCKIRSLISISTELMKFQMTFQDLKAMSLGMEKIFNVHFRINLVSSFIDFRIND